MVLKETKKAFLRACKRLQKQEDQAIVGFTFQYDDQPFGMGVDYCEKNPAAKKAVNDFCQLFLEELHGED